MAGDILLQSRLQHSRSVLRMLVLNEANESCFSEQLTIDVRKRRGFVNVFWRLSVGVFRIWNICARCIPRSVPSSLVLFSMYSWKVRFSKIVVSSEKEAKSRRTKYFSNSWPVYRHLSMHHAVCPLGKLPRCWQGLQLVGLFLVPAINRIHAHALQDL